MPPRRSIPHQFPLLLPPLHPRPLRLLPLLRLQPTSQKTWAAAVMAVAMV